MTKQLKALEEDKQGKLKGGGFSSFNSTRTTEFFEEDVSVSVSVSGDPCSCNCSCSQ
ncbi:hypothetical protein JCM19274_5014 [Algibacter lectus]|uniref:Uncharacterized protein n=1 Tax=Algibacter lectus TaxID=221126 RepID=A0A090WJX2_9FLAO|nr:hypothetical protein [Algibacter lectus]GAL77301.1 hypothetical protein JCM19274_5014 [Algibacter lectus]